MVHLHAASILEELAVRLTPVEAAGGVIFSIEAFKTEHPDIWKGVLKELGALDERPFRYLKDGKKGSAYQFGPKEVVKFTTDRTETEVMALLIGQKPQYLVHVFDVFWIPRNGNLIGCIRQELLQPGAADWKNFGELATFYFSQILNHPFDPIAVDQFKDWAVRRFSQRAQSSVASSVTTADEQTKVPPMSKRKATKPKDSLFIRENNPDRPFGKWVSKSAKMPTEEMFEWFRGLCKELSDYGISFYDLNAGNMMKRGGVHVVIDLGFSTAKSTPQVRTLQVAAMLERMARLLEARNTTLTDELAKRIGDQIGVDWSKIPLEEFKSGLEDETEHRDIVDPKSPSSNDVQDWVKYGEIAIKHLHEDPHYYAKLKKALAAKEPCTKCGRTDYADQRAGLCDSCAFPEKAQGYGEDWLVMPQISADTPAAVTPNELASFPNVWIALAKTLNIDTAVPLRKIGEGSNGTAYLTSNGSVLKLTRDKTEAQAMTKLIGRKSHYIVDVYRVISMANKLFALSMEKLAPPDPEWKKLFAATEQYFSMEQPVNNENVAAFAAQWQQEMPAQGEQPSQEQPQASVVKADDGMDDWGDINPGDDVQLDKLNVKPGMKWPGPYDQTKINWLKGLAHELVGLGIKFGDMNQGNIMKRGGDHVVIDLGMSQTNSAPQLEELGGQ